MKLRKSTHDTKHYRFWTATTGRKVTPSVVSVIVIVIVVSFRQLFIVQPDQTVTPPRGLGPSLGRFLGAKSGVTHTLLSLSASFCGNLIGVSAAFSTKAARGNNGTNPFGHLCQDRKAVTQA